MKMLDLLHAPTRLSWTARILVYIALVVTVALVLQLTDTFGVIP